MNTELPSPCSPPIERPAPLTPSRFGDILWDSAGEALMLAFLVLLMGGVVVGIVGGLLRDMTPSLPPVLSGKPRLEVQPSPAWDHARVWLEQHRFALLFVILFTGKTVARLLQYSKKEEHRKAVAWTSRVLGQVSEEWVHLVVVNAFTAFGVAMALHWSQAFSLTQLLWQFLAGLLEPVLHSISAILPGSGFINSLAGWYNENQFKFTFWLLYSAAICDDLGLPNYKSLGRWLWRRLRAATVPRHAPNPEG